MSGLTITAKNQMLDTLGNNYPFIALHSADPGPGGANELSGGIPPYVRRPAMWQPASNGVMTSDPVQHDVPAGSTVAYVGYWSLPAGGVFGGSRILSSSESFTAQGTFDASGSETLT